MTKRLWIVGGVLLVLTSTMSAQLLKRSDLEKAYGSRWLVLPLPDSRVGPGSIVSVKKGQVALESNLATCGAPAALLKATPGAGGVVTLNGDAEYAANAVLKLPGVQIGPDFKKVSKTTLKLEEHLPEGLDSINVSLWWNDQATTISPICKAFLTRSDVFLVLESYKAAKGRFTLLSSKDIKLSVDAKLVQVPGTVTGSGGVKVGADGTIEFSQPMYLAIRRLKLLKGGLTKTLGGSGETTDDALAKKLFAGSGKASGG